MYEEKTWAPWWLIGLLWGASLVGALSAATGGHEDARAIVAITLSVPLLITLIFMRLDVRVNHKEIRIAFGPVHVVRRSISHTQLASAEPVTFRPVRDFGGWGVRFMGRKGTAWTLKGNGAVKLTLDVDGETKLLYVGSPTPDRLASRINVMRGAD